MFKRLKTSASETVEQSKLPIQQFYKNSALRLPFSVDIGSERNEYGLSWRTLPGQYDEDTFSGRTFFNTLAGLDPVAFPHIISYGTRYAAWSGTSWKTEAASGTVGSSILSGTCGMLGSWFLSDTTIYKSSLTESLLTHVCQGLDTLGNPVEYNGFLFFSAKLVGNRFPVIGYLPPELWPDPQRVLQAQYFAIEHLGYCATVGVHKGQLVVVTNKGMWGVEPKGAEAHYILGPQLASWEFTQAAKFAVAPDFILAQDLGDLVCLGPSESFIIGQSRFTTMASNGSTVVLGSPTEVGVSNGEEFETHQGYTAVGMALVDPAGTLYVPSKVARSTPINLTLSTTTAVFPVTMVLGEVTCSEDVKSVFVTTEWGRYRLLRSFANPRVWKGGMSGRTMQFDFEVASNVSITPPTFMLTPRSKL